MEDRLRRPRHGESAGRVDRCPAVFIDRVTAQKYARRVGGRLPTKAEWEYAPRSGGKQNPWACSSTRREEAAPKAHLLSTSSTEPDPFPQPVKTFPEDQTDQKVFDMTGNVQEWCLDTYRPYAEVMAASQSPGQPWRDSRVGRSGARGADGEIRRPGGSYFVTANDAMVFQRTAASPTRN